ncbi:MAG: hypothetical protein WC314_28035, partial [Vulcanimicrobiota bacterium]
LRRLEEAVQAVALSLAEKQAALVHLHEHTYHLRPRTPLKRLDGLVRREEETQRRSGRENLEPGGLRRFLQAELWKNRRKHSMSYVSRSPPQS